MPNNLDKASRKSKRGDDTAALVAEMYGVTVRYVNMVIEGTRYNEKIVASYMQLKEGKSLLIEAVKKAVPFN